TTHVLLLACMQWAMAAGNGELDVLTSTPTRNRPARFAETIGCFVNPVIVRQRMDPQRSLLDNLTALRGAATAAYRHGAFPAARVVRELFPELLRQRIPLASSWFAIQVGTATQEVQQRHQFRLLNLAAGRAMGAGFALELRPVDGVLRGPFLTRRHFDPDHLAPRRFLDLVQALLSDPRQTLAQAWRRPLSN
ncbi:condensation domain-containing protein, partial [Ideonella azotifigens]